MGKYYTNSYAFSFLYFKLKFVVYVVTTLSCLLFIFLTSVDSSERLTVLNIILVKICEIRVFYYIFCVEVLHCQLKTINHEFKMNESKTVESKGFKWMRTQYNCVYDMTNFLNEVFGLSQVTEISYCFYIILANMNFLLTHYNDIPRLNAFGKCYVGSRTEI